MTQPKTVSVHRCRFVDFTPSAITALSFPPLSLPSAKLKGGEAVRKKLDFGTLAVGRANGNIELCGWTGSGHEHQAPQAWVVEKTLTGPYPSKVDSLAFAIRDPDLIPPDQTPSLFDLRLFSTGGGSDLAEWDIERGTIRRTIASQGGSIWAIATNPASTLLALGCEDGSIHLLSVELDSLNHLRRMDRVKSRILSLAWGPPVPLESQDRAETESSDSDDDGVDSWSDSWLVAGCSDSSLRKWDVPSGRVLDRMGTDKVKGERTLVWTVGVIGDSTIVSGDSLGMVKFWDSRTCTQLHSFQAHGADVLCMTISPEGTAIYTAGVDQKVVQFSLIKTSQPTSHNFPGTSSLLSRPSTSRWVQSFSRRMHSHDIRSLAIFPPYSTLPSTHTRKFPLDIAPILASGGLDMSVVLTPAALPGSTVTKIMNPLSTSNVATWEDAYHRRLAYSSGAFGRSALCMAKRARLVCCLRETGVTLWRIKSKSSSHEEEISGDSDPVTGGTPTQQSDNGGWEKVLDMDLNVQGNLVAGAISDDGKWIAVSDWNETKLFHLEALVNGTLQPRRVRTLSSILSPHLQPPSSRPLAAKSQIHDRYTTGSSAFVFTPDSSKLIMASSRLAYVFVLDLSTESPRVLRRFEHHRSSHGFVGKRIVVGVGRHEQGQTADDAEMTSATQVDGGSESEAGGEREEVSQRQEEGRGTSQTVSTIVTRMAVSLDGQWLATSDDRCRTNVFNLDSIQHHCILPAFPHSIHALSFLPPSSNSSHTSPSCSALVIGLANNTIHVYDVETRSFPSWSRHLSTAVPQRFKHLHDPIIGMTFNPTPPKEQGEENGRNVVFWGSTWLCKIQLDATTTYGGFEKKRPRDGSGKKRKDVAAATTSLPPPPIPGPDWEQSSQVAQSPNNFKLITQYRPILLADFIASDELVVVERPLVDVLAKLPPAYFKPKYGAS